MLHKDVINILMRLHDYSSIITMQDDGINAILRYTHQACVVTVMKVTHAIFIQFPHN